MHADVLKQWEVPEKGALKFFIQFLLEHLKNKGFCSKTSFFKFLACNWFCSLNIGHWGSSKCIDLMARTMQFTGSDIKLSSSDSISKVSSSASVTSMHSRKLSNQFSELELDMSTKRVQSILIQRPCQSTVSKVTVGFCTKMSTAFTPLAIRHSTQFSEAFTVIFNYCWPNTLNLRTT